ncbi:MAG: PAS domain S-box protein, partial [Bacteroidales bacterium]|nr:PAS domain S-box protein [Bacteroidales bacterium]
MNNSFEKIPGGFLKKWQEIADLIAGIIKVPAALIMKTENELMEVFTSSNTENNPYRVGDKEHWYGLYCETVIKTRKKLHIPNALKDKNWDKNPDIKLGMIAYLGYPINFPDNTPFGTICVLDNKERQFSAENEKLLLQFKKVIELDLALIFSLGLKDESSHAAIIQKLSNDNEEYQAINEELQQTEEALREREDKLSKILMAANDGMWDWDLRTNTVFFDPRYYQMSGYDVDEFPHNLEEFQKRIHTGDVDYVMNEAEKHLKGEIDRFDVKFRFRKKRGDWQWIQGKGIIVEWDEQGAPKRFVGTHRDISELKEVEEALDQSLREWQKTFDSANDAIWLLDKEQKVLRANQATQQIFPRLKGDPVGMNCWEIAHRTAEPIPECPFLRSKMSKRRETMDLKIDEGWFSITVDPVFDKTGEFSGAVHIVTDITERKQAEMQLQESENLLNATGKIARVGGWELDARTKKVSWTEETYHLHEVPLEYKPPLQEAVNFFHPEDQGKLTDAIERALEKGDPYDLEIRFITAKGKHLWTRTVCEPQIVDGKVVKLKGIFHDITTRKKAEEELKSQLMLLRIAGETARFGGWSVDLRNNICTWSDVVADVHEVPHGYVPPVEEGINFYAPEWRNKITQVFTACAEKGIPYDEEMEIITAKGKRVWVRTIGRAVKDENGRIIKVQGSFQNISKRKKDEMHIKHLNDVLSAIRNINQLIVREKRGDALIQQTCNLLLETRGYASAWIAVRDENGIWTKTAQQGLDDGFEPIQKMLNKGIAPDCVKRAIETKDLVITKKSSEDCPDCPLSKLYGKNAGLTIPLVHNDEIYGILVAAIAPHLIEDQKELELFREVGGDIAFALHDLRMTEKHRIAEQELRESEERFRTTLDNMMEGCQVIGFDLQYKYLNKKAAEHSKLTKEELLGKRCIDVFPKMERTELFRKIKNCLSERVPYQLENLFEYADGTTAWFDLLLQPVPQGAFILSIDITKRKQAEAALRESEERFVLAMKASNDGLFDWNLETNGIYYSPGWKKMLGYEDDELPNDFSVWENTTDPEDVKKSWDLQQKLISKQIDRFVMEFKMKHKEGHWVDILSRAEAIFNENGKAIRIVGTHTDITERKHAEDELRKLKENLESEVEQKTKELKERVAELERFHDATIEREFRVKELRDEI